MRDRSDVLRKTGSGLLQRESSRLLQARDLLTGRQYTLVR
jgi:hypothetical protein